MSRVERRKAQTHARIVAAAEDLMRKHGVAQVTIQDITEAADIGHGTFYLYFKSKDEVLLPLIESLSERVHAQVDAMAEGTRDPAIRMALGLRILLRNIAKDPLWGWYASRSDKPFSRMVADMGSPPAEDMEHALAIRRFKINDYEAATHFVDGALVGVVQLLKDGAPPETLADTTAELVLRVLGIQPDEAQAIVSTPLNAEEVSIS